VKFLAHLRSLSVLGDRFSSLSASADEPFKENGKVYIGGFVPGEAVCHL